jgi:benzoyl-CoA-dihydrodiol lyase
MTALGSEFWPLKLARELDDAILHIRLNEFDVAAIVFKSSGDPAEVIAYEKFLDANEAHWLVREIRHLWKRGLKRVDLTSRSLVTLIEPGSCFAGTLAEVAFASDRSYMLAPSPPSPASGGGSGRGHGGDRVDRCEFRRLPDVERADTSPKPLSRQSGRP